MDDIVTRIRRARRKKRQRDAIRDVLDKFLTDASMHFKMCGEGPKNSWSILFAQLWFTDCPCCLFYRGVTFGGVAGATIAGAGVGVLYLTGVL